MELPSPQEARVQAAWAAHRPYLLGVTAGMLKRRADAEDVVQEAFARLAAVSPDAVEDVREWLVVVTRRLCLDRLDLAGNRRATATAEPPEAPGGPLGWRFPAPLRPVGAGCGGGPPGRGVVTVILWVPIILSWSLTWSLARAS